MSCKGKFFEFTSVILTNLATLPLGKRKSKTRQIGSSFYMTLYCDLTDIDLFMWLYYYGEGALIYSYSFSYSYILSDNCSYSGKGNF